MAEPASGAEKQVPLLVICGPTATGKTQMAVRVAEAVGGEIVSADSMQIYRRLEIGVAKPTADERARARFHLVDIVEPDEPYNVALFQRDATCAIREIAGRGRLPILCGGTGLFIRAVTEGYCFPDGEGPLARATRRALEAELAATGPEAMHRRLSSVDPEAADRIAVADTKRVVRALEVYELTGKPMSALRRVDGNALAPYNVCSFALTCPRELLYRRIERRVDQMMAAGWLDETRELLRSRCRLDSQALQAIGYRHLAQHLLGASSLDEAVEAIKIDTRRYAKRQLTWFRRERHLVWLEWASHAQFCDALGRVTAEAKQLMHGALWGENPGRERNHDAG